MSRLLACLALMIGIAQPAHAGIPVLDVSNLVQSVQQALNSVTQVQNQLQQIRQLESQITQLDREFASLNGLRGLANLANNPLLQDYIPQGAPQLLQSVTTDGYAALNGAAKIARDAQMVYNCLDVIDTALQRSCQARLALPYQQKQLFTDALARASTRMNQINTLMVSAGTAADPKAIAEAQTRLAGEQAMLTHELTNVQLVQAQAAADQRVNISQSSERSAAQAAKGGDVGQLFR